MEKKLDMQKFDKVSAYLSFQTVLVFEVALSAKSFLSFDLNLKIQ
jgi:hypothetical protein